MKVSENKNDITKNTTVDVSQTFDNLNINSSKYTPLSRQDFDINIVDHWCEIRTKNQPKRRTFHSSFVHKDFYYIYGGVDIMSGKLDDFMRINLMDQAPKWESVFPAGNKLETLAYHRGCVCDGKYYIIGGQNTSLCSVNSVFIYDIESNSLEKISPQEEEFPEIESHSLNITSSKEILIFGGFINSCHSNRIYSFDTTTKTFKNLKPQGLLPPERANHSAVEFENNLYVFAGEGNDGKYLNDMWMYDINGNKWTEIKYANTEIPLGRSGLSMVLFKNLFYIFGGKTGGLNETNEFWKFNPSTKTFALLHDTLLEQYTPLELDDMKPNQESKDKNVKVFKMLTKKDVPSLNPFYKFHKDKKKKIKAEKNKLSRSQIMFEYKKKWESEMVILPDISKMARSTIYSIDNDIGSVIRMSTFKINSSMMEDISILGNVPFPRDGQSIEVYSNLLVLFGGDRNKFPYNDLYTFILP